MLAHVVLYGVFLLFYVAVLRLVHRRTIVVAKISRSETFLIQRAIFWAKQLSACER